MISRVLSRPLSRPLGDALGRMGGYDPSQELNLEADWWAERSVTEAGTGVASWLAGGKLGPLDYVQASDGDRPSYNASGLGGWPTIDFILANTDVLRLASGLTHTGMNWTLICAGDLLSRATTEYLLDSETGRLIFSPNRSSNPHIFDGSWIDTGAASTTGAAIRTWRLDDGANEFKFFRGASQIGSTAGFTGRALGGASAIGDGYGGAEGPLDMRVGRILLFSTIDATRDARVWAWMVSHYGLSL